ncbi:heme-binding protein [Erythrobacter sp. THAF29]|uniref:SOUL family heme-binding protein n=1 Tax=Erythrobacter sp. THAF29 TaxID=2587851 RepID=UPI001268B5D5|nr:heme-binding protein [Erythrobacter sp. THAF29]QFT78389.1 SOUL heme-binding protein [Erythrobacter sp. THAF29]
MGMAKWIAAGVGIAAVGAVAAVAQYRDIEEPGYEVLLDEDGFELRQYKPMIVAEVIHTGTRRQASGASFRRLAAYIFGQDRPEGGEDIAMTAPVLTEKVDQNEKIAMTAPVMQENTDGDIWRMRFVMPAKYTMETLPTPPADITLSEVPGRRIAAVRFDGYGRNSDLAVMEGMLNDWIERKGLTQVGSVEYAFYDAPMVPGPLRRNEVMVEVAAE